MTTATTTVTKHVTGVAAATCGAVLAASASTVAYLSTSLELAKLALEDQSKFTQQEARQTEKSGLKEAEASQYAAIGQIAGGSVSFAATTGGALYTARTPASVTENQRQVSDNTAEIDRLRDGPGAAIQVEGEGAPANGAAPLNPEQSKERITTLEKENERLNKESDSINSRSQSMGQLITQLSRSFDDIIQGGANMYAASAKEVKASIDSLLTMLKSTVNLLSTLAQQNSSNASSARSTLASLSQIQSTVVQGDTSYRG